MSSIIIEASKLPYFREAYVRCERGPTCSTDATIRIAHWPATPMPAPRAMKIAELRSALKERGLDTKGKKDDLVERLQEAIEDDCAAQAPGVSKPSKSKSKSKPVLNHKRRLPSTRAAAVFPRRSCFL